MTPKKSPFSDPPETKTGNDVHKAYNTNLYDHLQRGNSINFIQARAMGISQLDMQIAEIRKITSVYSRNVRINALRYMEYSLQPFV